MHDNVEVGLGWWGSHGILHLHMEQLDGGQARISKHQLAFPDCVAGHVRENNGPKQLVAAFPKLRRRATASCARGVSCGFTRALSPLLYSTTNMSPIFVAIAATNADVDHRALLLVCCWSFS